MDAIGQALITFVPFVGGWLSSLFKASGAAIGSIDTAQVKSRIKIAAKFGDTKTMNEICQRVALRLASCYGKRLDALTPETKAKELRANGKSRFGKACDWMTKAPEMDQIDLLVSYGVARLLNALLKENRITKERGDFGDQFVGEIRDQSNVGVMESLLKLANEEQVFCEFEEETYQCSPETFYR